MAKLSDVGTQALGAIEARGAIGVSWALGLRASLVASALALLGARSGAVDEVVYAVPVLSPWSHVALVCLLAGTGFVMLRHHAVRTGRTHS